MNQPTTIVTDKAITLKQSDILIVQAMSDGIPRKNIIDKVGIKMTLRTLETRVYLLMKEYSCISSAHLVAKFLRLGLIK